MYKKTFILLCMLLLLFNSLALAANYKLNIDDQLTISVWGHPDLKKEVRVGPNGNISFPLIGDIKAVDMTVDQLTKKITNKLSTYIKEPKVNISIISYKRLNVMVMGEVTKPGTYRMQKGDKILDAVSRAGGVTQLADMNKLKLTRNDKTRILNLDKMLTRDNSRDIDDNIQIQDGDVIYIPKSIIEVTVLGEVKQPGRYQVKKGIKITDLVAKAGGLTERAAQRVTYSTNDKKEKINIKKLFQGKAKKNPALKAGDSLYVPKVTQTVSILGEINQPGSYKWYENLKLTDLMAKAGNYTEKGDIEEVRITHAGGSSETVNLNNYLKEGTEKANPTLKPGDTVVIPELEKGLKVTVMGEIKRPGLYKWEKGLHLADLIAQAGNTTARGNLRNVKVKRENGQQSTYNVNKFFKENAGGENPLLQPGDTVVIEEQSSQVVILGEVNKPGSYSWHENLRLSDLLARAGNQTQRGDLEEIKVIHEDGSFKNVNLEEFLKSKKENANPSLKPGDVVVVNEMESINWEKVFTMISGLNGLKTFLGLSW